ncbi:MAG: flagellar basal-body rod protein FlgF [Rhodobacteraceae bacterium]|nr:flagellar basal-body rod protein FlgF [Paracoccaceae bacterium]
MSAQLSLMKRLETIAHNVANSSTVGFRAEEINFSQLVSTNTLDNTAFSKIGQTTLSQAAGALIKTDSPLDLAVNGNAWFAIQTPAGQVNTRDGRLKMLETGDLQTLQGYPILDVGGAPISLEPGAGPPTIAADGMITQNGVQVGAIGLFTIANQATLQRFESSGVIPSIPAEPVVNFDLTRVAQGFVENSNVNPVKQMTDLIAVSRLFEGVTNAIQDKEKTLQNAIRTLGGSPS